MFIYWNPSNFFATSVLGKTICFYCFCGTGRYWCHVINQFQVLPQKKRKRKSRILRLQKWHQIIRTPKSAMHEAPGSSVTNLRKAYGCGLTGNPDRTIYLRLVREGGSAGRLLGAVGRSVAMRIWTQECEVCFAILKINAVSQLGMHAQLAQLRRCPVQGKTLSFFGAVPILIFPS